MYKEIINNNPNDISFEVIEGEDIVIDDEDMIDNDIIDIAEGNQIEGNNAIDLNDLNQEILPEESSESSLNIINDYDNFKSDGEIYSLAMNQKGTLIIGDGEDNTYFYDASMKKIIKKEKFNKDSVTHVKITNDGKYILTASLDGTVNIFNSETIEFLKSVEGSFSDVLVNKFYWNLIFCSG